MGNRQTSTIKQCMEIVNKNMLSVINSKTFNAGAYQYNKNSIKFRVEGDINCPNINLSQTIYATQGMKVFSKFESANDLQQILKQALEQSVSSDQKAVNDFLSLGFNSQKTVTDLKTIINNTIDTQVRNDDITSCNSIVDNVNNQDLVITGSVACQNLNSAQNIVAAQQTECISETAFQVLMRSDLISEAVTNIANKQSAENKGITDFLKGLIGPLIIIGIIIVLVIIAKNVFAKNPQPYMVGYGGGYGSGSGVSVGASVNART